MYEVAFNKEEYFALKDDLLRVEKNASNHSVSRNDLAWQIRKIFNSIKLKSIDTEFLYKRNI